MLVAGLAVGGLVALLGVQSGGCGGLTSYTSQKIRFGVLSEFEFECHSPRSGVGIVTCAPQTQTRRQPRARVPLRVLPLALIFSLPTASLQATQAIQAKCPSTVTLQLPRSTLTPKPTMNLLPPRLHRQMAKGNYLLQEDVLALAVLLGAAVDRTTVALLHHLDVHLMLPLYVPYSSRGH